MEQENQINEELGCEHTQEEKIQESNKAIHFE